jgi:hypothetical protein
MSIKQYDFKISDNVKHITSGIEMEIVRLLKVYDVDLKQYVNSNNVECSWFEESKNINTIKEFPKKDLELI